MASNNQIRRRNHCRTICLTAIAVPGFFAVMAVAGCGPKPDPAAQQTIQSTGPKVVAPPAKPGMVIGAVNPPAGQPGHMSPAMQAQLQRYQALAQKK